MRDREGQRLDYWRFRVEYREGDYEQGDLPLRLRLRHEDVRQFIEWWLTRKNPTWIGQQLRTPDYWARPGSKAGRMVKQPGRPLSYHMVYQHVARLAHQGHIPTQWARVQPDWREERARAEGKGGADLEPTAKHFGNMPRGSGGYGALPPGLRPRKGRPPKHGPHAKQPAAPVNTADQLRAAGQRHTAPENQPLVLTIFDPDARPGDTTPNARERFDQQRDQIDSQEDAARRAVEEQLAAMRAKAAAEMGLDDRALIGGSASHSTTGDHEERIRPHGEEPSDDQRATLLHLDTNEGGTTHATNPEGARPGEQAAPPAGDQAARRDRPPIPGNAGAAHQEHPQANDARSPRRRERRATPQVDGQPQGKRRKGRNPGKAPQGDIGNEGDGRPDHNDQ